VILVDANILLYAEDSLHPLNMAVYLFLLTLTLPVFLACSGPTPSHEPKLLFESFGCNLQI
jgi:hypothetical protein